MSETKQTYFDNLIINKLELLKVKLTDEFQSFQNADLQKQCAFMQSEKQADVMHAAMEVFVRAAAVKFINEYTECYKDLMELRSESSDINNDTYKVMEAYLTFNFEPCASLGTTLSVLDRLLNTDNALSKIAGYYFEDNKSYDLYAFKDQMKLLYCTAIDLEAEELYLKSKRGEQVKSDFERD